LANAVYLAAMKLSRSAFILSEPVLKDELLLLFERKARLTIFDIGACEGEDAIRYSRFFPNSTVYAFEPRPDNLEKIDENLKRYDHGSIEVSHLALADKKGTSTFYLSSGQPEDSPPEVDWDFGNKSSSLLPPGEKMKTHTAWLEFKDTLEVHTDRLDNFMADRGLKGIDFIHMDVQGAELMVLLGAGDCVPSIKAIWLEVEVVELYKDQPLKTDIEEFMHSNGFVCVKSELDHVSGDQLYINTRFFSNDMANRFKFLKKKQRIRAIWRRLKDKYLI
jgi:2-O-methyltransferase